MKRTFDITGIRKELGMTQKEFSNHIGITQSYLSELENKRRSITELVMSQLTQKISSDILEKYTENISNRASATNGSTAVAGNGNRINDGDMGQLIGIIDRQAAQLSKSQEQLTKSQEQIDRLLTLLEKK